MTDAIARVPVPHNEPVKDYAPGSAERARLKLRLEALASDRIEIPMVIGGAEVATGTIYEAVMPHETKHVLGEVHQGEAKHLQDAVAAAGKAHAEWANLEWSERAAVFLRAAELLAGPWRDTINASTMLGQSKTVHQAEI